MPDYSVPFNRPLLIGDEFAYMQDAVSRWSTAGNGYYTQASEGLLANYLESAKALLTSSCTHALDMTGLLLDIQPGDEVILPSFTFVSTANAYVLRKAKPIFVDIRPDTLNIDERLLEAAITPRTKAIIVVHYAGIACAMDEIMQLSAQHGIPIIEDNAHGLFGSYKKRRLGSLGLMATQSFHETKNIMCGEGGALILNDPTYVERAEIIREKGTNRSKFYRGEVDKYSWVDVGSSYLMSDLSAAYLYAQLQQASRIQQKRHRIWQTYHSELSDWAARHEVQQPTIPEGIEHAAHIYYMVMPTPEQRDAFLVYLKENGISAVFHYVPLHLSAMGSTFGGQVGDCPVTEHVSASLLRLPLFYDLDLDAQGYVIDTIRRYTP